MPGFPLAEARAALYNPGSFLATRRYLRLALRNLKDHQENQIPQEGLPEFRL